MSSYCFYSQDALEFAQSSGVDKLINDYAEQYKGFEVQPYENVR